MLFNRELKRLRERRNALQAEVSNLQQKKSEALTKLVRKDLELIRVSNEQRGTEELKADGNDLN